MQETDQVLLSGPGSLHTPALPSRPRHSCRFQQQHPALSSSRENSSNRGRGRSFYRQLRPRTVGSAVGMSLHSAVQLPPGNGVVFCLHSTAVTCQFRATCTEIRASFQIQNFTTFSIQEVGPVMYQYQKLLRMCGTTSSSNGELCLGSAAPRSSCRISIALRTSSCDHLLIGSWQDCSFCCKVPADMPLRPTGVPAHSAGNAVHTSMAVWGLAEAAS